jgi:F-type H+-transporting ATPase subunit b
MTSATEPTVHPEGGHASTPTDTHASTEAEHGSGGLPQLEFQHWFGQIVYLVFLFVVLYFLMAKVFAPRMRRVFDERAETIAKAIEDARSVQEEAQNQATTAQAEVAEARASSRRTANEAKARVTADIASRQAAQEAVLAERVAEAEGRIARMRDQAMSQVQAVADDTTKAVVEKLTGKTASAAELAAAKGAA